MKDSDFTKHHEVAHYIKRHSGTPRKPEQYVKDELEANLYAKEKTGKGTHIKHRLVGIVNSIANDYDLPLCEALAVTAKQLRGKNIPVAWKRDFNQVVKKQVYPKRKVPKYVTIKEIR